MLDQSYIFKDRFAKAFAESKFTSYRQLSLEAKCSEPQVSQIIKGKFDGSKAGPGIFTLTRLARALGRSLDSFVVDSEQPVVTDLNVFNGVRSREDVTINALLAIHWRSGGRLQAFGKYLEYFDLYKIASAESSSPELYRLGAHTLFSMRIETTDIRVAQRELDRLPLQKRRETMAFHSEVVEKGMAIDNAYIDHRLNTRAVHVRAGYSKLGLTVEGPNGESLVLIACDPIPV